MAEERDRIGGYRIESRMDRDAEIPLYKGADANGTPVAIRVYPSTESEAVREIRREALTASKELKHPNIARVLEVGEDDGSVWAASEFAQGATLATVLRHKHLSPRAALVVLKAIAGVVDHAFSKGVPVEGIEPGRVLVQGEARSVKLIETGMPLHLEHAESGKTATIRALGAVRYLAPERMARPNERPAASAAVYSMGILGYEMLTGSVPVGAFRLPSQVDSEIPPDIDPVIMKCLSREPRDRYRDAAGLLAALGDLEGRVSALQSGGFAAAVTNVGEAGGRRVGLIAGGLGIAAVVLVVIALRAC